MPNDVTGRETREFANRTLCGIALVVNALKARGVAPALADLLQASAVTLVPNIVRAAIVLERDED